MRRSSHYFTALAELAELAVLKASDRASFQMFGGDTLWPLPSLAHRFGVRGTESGFNLGVVFAPQKTNAAR